LPAAVWATGTRLPEAPAMDPLGEKPAPASARCSAAAVSEWIPAQAKAPLPKEAPYHPRRTRRARPHRVQRPTA
jgi:hypothetical protein